MSERRYVYLVEARPVDDAGVERPQYWSAGQSADPRPYGDIEFVNCLMPASSDRGGPWTYSAELALDASVGGRSVLGYGALRLDLQHLDDFTLSTLALLHWDARALRIWRVREGSTWALTDTPMFRGTTDEPTWGITDATIPLFDRSRELDVPWLSATYAGTGTYEGQSDIKGQRKPRVLGRVLHCEPIALDHAAPDAGGSPFARVAQVSDLTIKSNGLSVYERGVAFADASIHAVSDVYTWTPIAGHVAVDVGRGVLRFGSAPVGVCTVVVDADEVDSTHVGLLALVILTADDGKYSSADFDAAALAALQSYYPSLAGIYVNDDRTVAAVCDALAQSIGSAWKFTPAGLFTVRQIGFRTSVMTLTADDLLDDPQVVTLPPPVWRYEFGAAPCERVLNDSDIGDAAVPSTVRTFITSATRAQVTEVATVKDVRPLARESVVQSRFIDTTFAAIEGSRQHNLLRRNRRQYVITVNRPFGSIREGDTVTWSYPGFGLDDGADFLVRAVDWRPGFFDDEDEVSLTLWGPFEVGKESRVTTP